MNASIAFRPEAEADVLETYAWYESQQSGLGETFVDFVDEALNRIKAMPRMYPVAIRNIRRAKIGKFPYLVFYRVLPQHIEIIGILHGSRNPKLWQQRIS